MTVVESELKLVKVAVEMLNGNLMVRANDRTLEKAPDVLKGVSVDDATHVWLAYFILFTVPWLTGRSLASTNRQ